LYCDKNQIAILDISNNFNLYDFSCAENQLTSLGISNYTFLHWVLCEGNQLTDIDVSKSTQLNSLYCGGNLFSKLDVSNNIELKGLHIDEMTTLHEVCVWTMPFPPEDLEVDTTGSPNVYFTTECSE